MTMTADELSGAQILTRLGKTISASLTAFREDPSYLVDMAEHAGLISYKRDLWKIRGEAQRERRAGISDEPMEELIRHKMDARGVKQPPRLSRVGRTR